ncbi:hypothetical protein [Lysobacter gummosus]
MSGVESANRGVRTPIQPRRKSLEATALNQQIAASGPQSSRDESH